MTTTAARGMEWRLYPTREKTEAVLAEAAARYRRYESEGNAACSDSDLRNGYDAHFNMHLASCHIISARYCLEPFPAELFAAPDPAEGLELHSHPHPSICTHSTHK